MPVGRVINPIIPGFSPDPSIVHVAGWYFLVTSTFHLFPGLPIYVSQDLISWRQIGNAINRQGQLSLSKSSTRLQQGKASTGGKVLPATAGLYAPTIRYHEGKFFIVCTNCVRQDKEKLETHNFVISTNDIWSSTWSDPIYFDFIGIDPDLFFEDGKTYVTGSRAPGPWTKISCFELDIETGKLLTEERTIWTGTGGIHPEGPHIYKRNGWYYLLVSEGGTHVTHMLTMARSRSIWGPYKPCPDNPVLTAAGTNEYVQHTGHGDLFQGPDGQWLAVCLAVRKDKNNRYGLGRETFLTSVTWNSEWPSFQRVRLDPQISPVTNDTIELVASPFLDYLHIRDATLDNYHFGRDSNIILTASSVDFSNSEASPTFVGKRQRKLQGSSTITISRISDQWAAARLKCGLAYYKDEYRFFRVLFDTSDASMVFEENNTAQDITRTTRQKLGQHPNSIHLRMEYTEQEFHLKYSLGPRRDGPWISLASVDILEMTDPDFVGPVIGPFAVSDKEGLRVEFTDFYCD